MGAACVAHGQRHGCGEKGTVREMDSIVGGEDRLKRADALQEWEE